METRCRRQGKDTVVLWPELASTTMMEAEGAGERNPPYRSVYCGSRAFCATSQLMTRVGLPQLVVAPPTAHPATDQGPLDTRPDTEKQKVRPAYLPSRHGLVD
ncbi:hypothetical protein NDU88_002867 [Pleurodeles waltl]|uniref:Uncharacterized protein n=1 Tax=Pleurodeles waltl TaxID=8319 RepID=A0AAV7W422_PLEWA|nr:hypothetical protein NDU88_002867 [Pleurodeles waltl]